MGTKRKRKAVLSRMLRLFLGVILAVMGVVMVVWLSTAWMLLKANRHPSPDEVLLAPNSDSGGSSAMDSGPGGIPPAPTYTILQRQIVYDTHDAILYLYSWTHQGQTCLAVREASQARDIFGGWFGFTLSTNCEAHRYTSAVTMEWKRDLQVVFGFSGDAERVEIEFEDKTVSIARSLNNTYMLVVRKEAWTRVERVSFLDSEGAILHTLTAEDVMQ